MFKKFTCLTLCLLLLIPVFASCQKSGDLTNEILDEASRYTTTLNVWMITEEGTDPEQAAAVNAAINRVTKEKFKTQLNIKLFTEDEYYSALEQAFAARKKADDEARAAKKAAQDAMREAIKRGESYTTTAETVRVEETVLNEYGLPELKYPEAPDYQVDILFVNSFEKYRDLVDRGLLATMDELMADSAGQLPYYINNIFLDAVVYDGATYAIPNNHVIGEYTFLVADRELLNNYGYTTGDIKTSSVYDDNFYSYLKLVQQKNLRVSPEEQIVPLYCENGKLDLSLVHYWNFDAESTPGMIKLTPDVFSIYGSVFSNGDMRGSSVSFANILQDNNYAKRWKYKVEYETTPGFITTDPNVKTAAKIVKGNYLLKEEYEKLGYEVMVMESPRANDQTVYNSMFSIGAYSTDSARSMEIISYLNTNKELRNLLQYGIEGVNYTLKTVTEGREEYAYVEAIEGNAYFMDVAKTGNCFIAYADSLEGARALEWYKKQNLEATTYPTLGMYFSKSVNQEAVRIVDAVSEKVAAYMEATLQTTEAANQFFANATAAARRNEDFANFLMGIVGNGLVYNEQGAVVTKDNLLKAFATFRVSEIDDGKDALQSPNAEYNEWLVANGFAK